MLVGSVATNSWHGTTTFGTGAQLWEIPPVRGGFVPRGKANGQAAPPTGNSYGILPPVRADRPVPNVADLPNVGSNASYGTLAYNDGILSGGQSGPTTASAGKRRDVHTTEGSSTARAEPAEALEAGPTAPSPKMCAPSRPPTYLLPMYV